MSLEVRQSPQPLTLDRKLSVERGVPPHMRMLVSDMLGTIRHDLEKSPTRRLDLRTIAVTAATNDPAHKPTANDLAQLEAFLKQGLANMGLSATGLKVSSGTAHVELKVGWQRAAAGGGASATGISATHRFELAGEVRVDDVKLYDTKKQSVQGWRYK